MELFLIIWIMCNLIVAAVATMMGGKFFRYFMLSFIVSPFIALIVLFINWATKK